MCDIPRSQNVDPEEDWAVTDFSRVPGLEELILFSSGTESIANHTFKALSRLKSLELLNNKLRNIPRPLPSSLEVLKLGDNLINVIQQSDFEGLKKLQVLEIKNNLVTAFSAVMFSPLFNLQTLVLDGNCIETASGPLRLPRLKNLSLENNKLQSFPGNFFAHLPYLQYLSLSGNLLTKIPHELPKTLQSIKLERNHIKHLRLREVKHLENVTDLLLSNNQISSLDGALLPANLTALELSRNQLKTVPPRLPSRLQKLDCSGNFIPKVTLQDFQGLQDLKHLFLDNNAISYFEGAALQRCAHLTNLALEQNLLTAIPLRLPVTLARLDLKGNHIEAIREQELMHLKQLQVLNLRNNKISALDRKVVECLPRLRHLYLDGNPWNCTCDLLKVKKLLTEKGMDVKSGQCVHPEECQGESWMSSRKILQHCEQPYYYAPRKGKEDRRKVSGIGQAIVRAQLEDDEYDYEID
ncbi:nephrocan-like [Ambystoma mexicanum]|uniref:nephrocan-like n=1 Tax=Ambystoma mexicanum TaxID=8296 RepID=UPI0037E98E4A